MIFSDAQPVQFWLSRLETFNEKSVPGVFQKCFCAPFEADDTITVQFEDSAGYTRKLVIYDENGTLYTTNFAEVSSGLYQLSFTPRSIGITDNEIQLKITDGINLELAKSDCISIKEDQDETVLINYTNNRILASLNSGVGTPDPEFYLRIPAIFFEERFPQEMEVMDLSNNRSLQLNAQVKSQTLLQVKPMPFYMHRKTKLALLFQSVVIDEFEWIMGESYELQPSNPRYPLRKATCWLTQKEYIVRNVL